jgi:hypothetical protein
MRICECLELKEESVNVAIPNASILSGEVLRIRGEDIDNIQMMQPNADRYAVESRLMEEAEDDVEIHDVFPGNYM